MRDRSTWSSRQTLLTVTLGAAAVILIGVCVALTLPFLPALTWAVALSIVAQTKGERPARHSEVKPAKREMS